MLRVGLPLVRARRQLAAALPGVEVEVVARLEMRMSRSSAAMGAATQRWNPAEDRPTSCDGLTPCDIRLCYPRALGYVVHKYSE